MADKLPWFSFYCADWIRDTRMLSLEARAVWLDLLTLMHDSDRRGYLINRQGKPFTPEQLAAYCACSREMISRIVQELISSGVASSSEAGVLYSRRMVNDERKRKAARQAGKRGGNPALLGVKGGVNPKDKLPLTLALSSNSSSDSGEGGAGEEVQKPPPTRGRAVDCLDPEFDRFWAVYPRKAARVAARIAWDALAPDKPLVEAILRAVAEQAKTVQWKKGIIPNPDKWLADNRWEDELTPTPDGGLSVEERKENMRKIKEELRPKDPLPEGTRLVDLIKQKHQQKRVNDDSTSS